MTEADKPPFEWVLDDTKDGVTIKLDGKSLHLSTGEFEAVLLEIGRIRERLRPPVPPDVDQAVPLITAAQMKPVPVGPAPATETGCALLFRSAYFGWFRFQATPEVCKDLMRVFTEPPPKTPPRILN